MSHSTVYSRRRGRLAQNYISPPPLLLHTLLQKNLRKEKKLEFILSRSPLHPVPFKTNIFSRFRACDQPPRRRARPPHPARLEDKRLLRDQGIPEAGHVRHVVQGGQGTYATTTRQFPVFVICIFFALFSQLLLHGDRISIRLVEERGAVYGFFSVHLSPQNTNAIFPLFRPCHKHKLPIFSVPALFFSLESSLLLDHKNTPFLLPPLLSLPQSFNFLTNVIADKGKRKRSGEGGGASFSAFDLGATSAESKTIKREAPVKKVPKNAPSKREKTATREIICFLFPSFNLV